VRSTWQRQAKKVSPFQKVKPLSTQPLNKPISFENKVAQAFAPRFFFLILLKSVSYLNIPMRCTF
jgi:hypothetical protein